MKILLLTDEYYPYHIGGAGVVASQIVSTLQDRKIDCDVRCSNPKNKFLRKVYNVIWPVWALFSFLIPLFKKYDKIIVNDLRSAYIIGLIGNSFLLQKVIYIIHGTEIDIVFKKRTRKNSMILLPIFFSRFLRSCKKVIYVSEYVSSRTKRELLLHGIEPRTQYVSYAGLSSYMLDIARTNINSSFEAVESIRLVSYSRLERRKGYLEMLALFSTIIERGVKISWDIYGYGNLRSELEKKITKMKLNEYINLLGPIDRNTIAEVINPQSYDAYWLLPVEPEAFGLTYIECSAVGIPVIGPQKYGIQEAICEGMNGFFFKNTEKMVEDLLIIKNNKCGFIKSCKSWALKFDSNNFVDQVIT